jgi:hypothetical protein
MDPKNFFAELKRRNVYKVAIAYGVIAWLLMQIASQIFPFFEIPNWAVRLVVLLLILGFPIALVLAWAFDLTPEGLKRTEWADREPARPSRNKAWRQTESVKVAAKSIAVMPFENRSEDKANAYFADGIQDEILTLYRGLESNFAHVHAAISEQTSQSHRDREAAWRSDDS